jgi:hypothetical protein
VRPFNAGNVGVTNLLPKFSETDVGEVARPPARRALIRSEEAKALRKRYGAHGPETPKPS